MSDSATATPAQSEPPLPNPTPKQRRVLRSIVLVLLMLLLLLISALVVMVSTNKGSQFLLDRVLSQQKMMEYQYGKGNLLSGITLNKLHIKLKKMEIKADSAEVELGWRALLTREVHLNRADLTNLQIINKGPPSNKPFGFSPIKLPIVLRINQANLDHLSIHNTHSTVHLYDIRLNDALWSGTQLKFKNSAMNMGYLDLKKADGQIDFKDKYPLKATGDLTLPSLAVLNIKTIRVHATGTLDTIQAGVATQTPDLLTGWAVVRPLQPNVPMYGQLNFKQYDWPLATAQKLFTKDGSARFNGNIHRLNINLSTDLQGQQLPAGYYTAQMHTDLTHKLNIAQFNAQLMGGSVNLMGEVGWHKQVSWNVQGRLQGLNAKDAKLPAQLRDFLPPNLDANLRSSGVRNSALSANVNLDFDRYENWSLQLNQKLDQKLNQKLSKTSSKTQNHSI